MALVFGIRISVNRLLHLTRITNLTARTLLVQDGVAFLIVLAVSAIMGVFEKRSLAIYGLPLRGAFRSCSFEGILWGFLAECATMLTLYFTGDVAFEGLDQRGASALYFGALWAIAFLMVGLFEELLFRGYTNSL